MTTHVLICDDSALARKQLAKALPGDWDIELSFAANGAEALAAVASGKGDILFLDLNMPEMDGYQVLEALQQRKLTSRVIVVSGDIQPEAQTRVQNLGALAFIKKPVPAPEITDLLERFKLRGAAQTARAREDVRVESTDGYKEIANVAMGRAADRLARLLDVFVQMPIPQVNMLEVSELQMALQHVAQNDRISALCQGFIGSGIAGEALLIFNETSFKDIAELMHFKGALDEGTQLELLMDVGSVLNGALLQGIADQLDIRFSQGHPMVLGRHINIAQLLERSHARWRKTLAIEMGYTIENRNISCDVLLLFTDDSIARLDHLVSLLAD